VAQRDDDFQGIASGDTLEHLDDLVPRLCPNRMERAVAGVVGRGRGNTTPLRTAAVSARIASARA
jgi:hypothetical protein